jgi:hypothetical protein
VEKKASRREHGGRGNVFGYARKHEKIGDWRRDNVTPRPMGKSINQ